MESRKINGAKVVINGSSTTAGSPVAIKGVTGSKVVPITIDLSEADVLDKSYVEGYVRIVPKNEKYTQVNVPLMGFYGDWNDAPNVDEAMVDGEPFAEYTAVFQYDSDAPLGFDAESRTINKDRVAFSPTGYANLVGPRYTVLRNLEHISVSVEDAEGNVVKELYEDDYVSKNTFYNRNSFYNISDYSPWDGTDKEGKVVKDGVYNFVIKSKLAYEGSETQERRLDIKVDGTNPVVKDVDIQPVDEGYEITFEVIDESSGFEGAVVFVDEEYMPLQRGEKSCIVPEMPKEVVVTAFDYAGNTGIGVYGDSKEVSSSTVVLYYSVAGEYVNYENSCYIYGATGLPMIWDLSIIGPTGDVVYKLDEIEESIFSSEFMPEQGEPNGKYMLVGRVTDRDTGIYAKLEDYEINIADNEICDKTELFNTIMAMKQFESELVIGEEPGQYTQEVVDEFDAVLQNVIDVYYEPSTTEEDIAKAIEAINSAKELLLSKKNPSEGKKSAIELLDYCNKLIEEAVIGDRPGNYSQESVDRLKSSMDELQKLVDSEEEISDEEFGEAIDKLNSEVRVFLDSAVKEGNTENSTQLIKQEKQYLETVKNGTSEYKYTKESVEKLEAVLASSEKTLEEPLTVEEADEVYANLVEAVNEFEAGKIDVSGLREAVKNGELCLDEIKGTEDMYSKEAIEELKATIESGKAVLGSSYTTKEQVSWSIAIIKVAIKDVKDSKKEPAGPSDPTDPSDPSDPEDPSNPTDPSNPGDDGEDGNSDKDTGKDSDKDTEKLPQTGNGVGSGIIFVGFAMAALGTVMVRNKKRVK